MRKPQRGEVILTRRFGRQERRFHAGRQPIRLRGEGKARYADCSLRMDVWPSSASAITPRATRRLQGDDVARHVATGLAVAVDTADLPAAGGFGHLYPAHDLSRRLARLGIACR
ncbi:MAG TPA: hypothetical protein VK988_10615 [Acidimicrobiales bacterium]|nr:hypothetical protein [Acidimicrobiales bacterium]